MECDFIKDDKGKVVAILCGGRRRRVAKCQECRQRDHTQLCDYRIETPGKTCDRKLCAECAVRIAKDVDYCPGHPR